MQGRQVAYKLWIQNIVGSQFVEQEGEWEPNYIDFNHMKVSRVNIIATVVDSFTSPDNNYSTIVLDDGSAEVRVRAFKEDVSMFSSIKIGDIVLVVGRTRKYNDEIYILPEIIRKIDNPNWEVLRKFELLRDYGAPEKVEIELSVAVSDTGAKYEKQGELEEPPEEGKIEITSGTSSGRQKIISFIEKQEEASVNSIVQDSGLAQEEVNAVLKELLKEGEIYQPRPGYFRIV
ncbi:MAG: OB-fold nucleic acid binding domain-containing protein [Nanoarchaeota archaeon]